MRQLRIVGWLWTVLGSLATAGFVIMGVVQSLQSGFEADAQSYFIGAVVCGLGAYAGFSLRTGVQWARITVGAVAGLFALNFSLFGLWALSLHLSAPGSTTVYGYVLFGILPPGVLLLGYTAIVALVAGRKTHLTSAST